MKTTLELNTRTFVLKDKKELTKDFKKVLMIEDDDKTDFKIMNIHKYISNNKDYCSIKITYYYLNEIIKLNYCYSEKWEVQKLELSEVDGRLHYCYIKDFANLNITK